ncbi:MAG: hypothetical protein EPN97_06565 [Alphaproteobacteria bacterium]|nr:MAG: hypothetical protein EPN97_06565 [Alphaproteobacteria bacterium]
MKNAVQKTFSPSAVKTLIVAAFALLALHSTAFGQEPIDMAAGRYDLLRAHNERVIVSFGSALDFKRYAVVEILHQYFVVASEVKGGVRYNLQSDASRRTLVIE